ncbi:TPA: hypothetical protein ACQ31I_002846 [Yersinia enterocolitica]
MMPVHQQPIAHVVILLSRHNTEYLEYWVAQDKNYGLDLEGNIPNNKALENGKLTGRNQSEYNEITHFKIKGE